MDYNQLFEYADVEVLAHSESDGLINNRTVYLQLTMTVHYKDNSSQEFPIGVFLACDVVNEAIKFEKELSKTNVRFVSCSVQIVGYIRSTL